MNGRARSGAHDLGMSLIEVLMAVALLGIAVAGTLPLVSAGIFGSGLQGRFAGARRWIVGAGDYAVNNMGRESCLDTPQAQIKIDYQDILRDSVPTPDSYLKGQLTVTDVQFWNGSTFTSKCAETKKPPTFTMQLISLQVDRPDHGKPDQLDVVKDG